MWCSSRVSAWRREPNSHEAAEPPLTAAACGQSHEQLTQQVASANMVWLRCGVVRRFMRSNVARLTQPLAHPSRQQNHIAALARSAPCSASASSPAPRDAIASVSASTSSIGQFTLGLHWRRCRPGGRSPRPARPNNSFNRTRYGKRRKPGPRHMVHHRAPGLRRLPPRAG
jgi:hypothetical protein